MNNIKFQTKILNTLIIISTLLVFSKGEIIDNPYLISENENPIKVVRDGECIQIFTSGKLYYFQKGHIGNSYSFPVYSAPCIYIEKEGWYIFTNNEYFTWQYEAGGFKKVSRNKPGLTYPNSDKHIGQLIELGYEGDEEYCKKSSDERIIYGKRNSGGGDPNSLYFTYLTAGKSYGFPINRDLEDKIECRFFRNDYICVSVQDHAVYIYLYYLATKNKDCEMKNTCNVVIGKMSEHTYVELYEYFEIDSVYFNEMGIMYFLCAKNRKTYDIECLSINENDEDRDCPFQFSDIIF